jgi:hypothetical protein
LSTSERSEHKQQNERSEFLKGGVEGVSPSGWVGGINFFIFTFIFIFYSRRRFIQLVSITLTVAF